MATRGPKPTPLERKAKLGMRDKNKNREITVLPTPVARVIPIPHRQLLTIDGQQGPGGLLWERFWRAGASWLREDDAELLMILCEQEDERAILRRMVFQTPDDWRARAGLRLLEKLITDNLSLLGFTPTDRARMGVRSQGIDPLEEFRKRVEAKRQQTAP
jgi:hypothetical protein